MFFSCHYFLLISTTVTILPVDYRRFLLNSCLLTVYLTGNKIKVQFYSECVWSAYILVFKVD